MQRMAAYHVADATDAIKLDAMENPWRLPGALQAELAQRLAALAINRYPSGNTYTALKQAIARHDGLDGIDGLVLGNGSDELISLLCQLVAQPGATIMAPAPSFVMYEMGARLAGVGFVPVPLRPDFSLDREAMLQAIETHRPALVFLAYPNNPTGNLFDADDVRAILQATDGLVVLDEAYAPFAGGASWLSQLTAWPNLAVMRTCSKWGLAGARIGYLASAPAWAAQLDKIRPPYNISALDAETACFAFQHHADFDHQTQALCTERQTLVQRLQALRGPQGLSHVYPTAANFVLVRLAGGQDDAAGPSRATRVATAMRAAGVLIKDASRMHPALAECLRLTVGAPEENEAMLQALAAALDAVPAASAGLADGASRTADANGRAHGERTSS
ncbi:MAG: histidinol-phosphate transaminase [Lautropia mirabilis]